MSDRSFLFFALFLAVFINGCCSFRVRRRGYDIRLDNEGLQTVLKRLSKRQTRLSSCYENCQECRNLYGYLRYNYTACALRCSASDGGRSDSECEAFRVETKRTSRNQSERQQCKNYCNSLANSDNCQAVTPFTRELSLELCAHYCNEDKFSDAVKVNCATTLENQMNVFRPA